MIPAGSLALPVGWRGLLPVWLCRWGERVALPGRCFGLVVPAGAGLASVAASGGAFGRCRLGQDHAQLASMILAGSLALPVGWRGLLPVWLCRCARLRSGFQAGGFP